MPQLSEKPSDGMNLSVREKARDGGGTIYELDIEKAGDDLIRMVADFGGFENPSAWIAAAIAHRLVEFAKGERTGEPDAENHSEEE